jgi:hypothetical protein
MAMIWLKYITHVYYTTVFCNIKIFRHNITEILLKEALTYRTSIDQNKQIYQIITNNIQCISVLIKSE